MTCLILMRHGPTAWNAEKRLQGLNDIPLSEAGRGEVAAWVLVPEAGGALWYTSPLSRARETAAILGAPDAAVEPRLSEMSWGDWEGRKVEDVRALAGGPDLNGGQGLDFCPPGGESRRQVMERLKPFFARVGRSERTCIGITHKGVIEAAMVLATGWDMRGKRPAKVGPGASHVFDVDPGGNLSVIRLNDNGRQTR